jgi:hypothetical protein
VRTFNAPDCADRCEVVLGTAAIKSIIHTVFSVILAQGASSFAEDRIKKVSHRHIQRIFAAAVIFSGKRVASPE